MYKCLGKWLILLAKMEQQRPKVPSHLKQLKDQSLYETMVSITLELSNKEQCFLRKWETKEVSPPIVSAYCLVRVSKPQHREGNADRAQWSPWVEKTAIGVIGACEGQGGENRIEQRTGEESTAQRCRVLIPLKYWQNIDLSMCMRKSPETRARTTPKE